ncbi:MAG: T9SS type A sorting domain-containing protein [Dysgonamonadaceae bacterium]|jgi:hypothetical protein|nr:T9SS type A sorting domain-containing protein [Dysgonamonadaceae bacterium]
MKKIVPLIILAFFAGSATGRAKVVYAGKIPGANPEKVTVTLNDNSNWYGMTGYGFVLFIGADLNMSAYTSSVESNYESADYIIPQNSTFDGYEVSSCIGSSGTKSQTIEIEEGIYKYRILFIEDGSPRPDVNVLFNSSPVSFDKGWEYIFTTVNNEGEASFDKPKGSLESIPPETALFELPFTDNFSASYTNQWRIIDANGDGKTWTQPTTELVKAPDDNSGTMAFMNSNSKADDYLITKAPIVLPASGFMFKIMYRTAESPESFMIMYGKSDNINELQPLGEEIYCSQEEWQELTVPFQMEEAGNYYFAIKATSSNPDRWLLAISMVAIEEISGHDIEIQNVRASFAPYTPATHWNTPVNFTVSIKNSGKNSEDFKLKFIQEETVTEQNLHLPFNSAENFVVPVTVSDVSASQTITFTVQAALENDATPENNEQTYILYSTDNIFAMEDISVEDLPEKQGVGASAPVLLGNIFTLNKVDKLSAFIALFANNSDMEEKEIGLTVFKVEEQTSDGKYRLGNEIFSTTVARPKEGFRKWILENPVELAAGTYYFGIRQLTDKNLAIASTEDITGVFYEYEEDESSVAFASAVSGFGNIALRADFNEYPLNVLSSFYDTDIYAYIANKTLYIHTDRQINQIVIGNLTGIKVYQSANDLNTADYKININHLPHGIYFAAIRIENNIKTIKFIIKK